MARHGDTALPPVSWCTVQQQAEHTQRLAERLRLPMVAVYLLGHRVGDIKEPVVYVNHDVYDYNGKVVKDGKEEPFVESLTHNSIIVQIPRLKGRVNNRLEKVLSVFDQSRKDAEDKQVLNIDENKYEDDADMMYMLHRLTAAAADSEMRQDMNVEDEYYKAIEDRDTAIMKREKELKQKDEQLQQKDEQLQQKSEQLQQRDEQLQQRDEQLKNVVKLLYSNGMDTLQIAKTTGISNDEVTAMLK